MDYIIWIIYIYVYADNTQLYNISYTCKQSLEAISKLNCCLADIMRWMITNKLKINDSKTEFIVFRSLQLKCDSSGLAVNVGAICRSTHFHIGNIGKIRNLLSYDAFSTIIHALIRCRLDQCNYIIKKKFIKFIRNCPVKTLLLKVFTRLPFVTQCLTQV